MSVERHKLTIRFNAVLRDLEYLAEGDAMAWDSERTSSGKAGSSPPKSQPSTLDAEAPGIIDLIEHLERVVARERKGRKPETSPVEIEFRILHDYVGRNAETVAEDVGWSVKSVGDVREKAGYNRKYGNPLK